MQKNVDFTESTTIHKNNSLYETVNTFFTPRIIKLMQV